MVFEPYLQVFSTTVTRHADGIDTEKLRNVRKPNWEKNDTYLMN